MSESEVHPYQIVSERLQARIGNLIGQIEMVNLQVELLMRERDNLKQIIASQGLSTPESQVVIKKEEGNGVDAGRELSLDRGSDSGGEEAGPPLSP